LLLNVPACGNALPASIVDTTMYPTQECSETKKESLEADDILANPSPEAVATEKK